MPSVAQLASNDYDGEPTRFRFFIATITGANHDAQLANVQEVQDAVNGVSLATFNGKKVATVDISASGSAATKAAQREIKWRVRYVDNTDPIGDGSFEIGAADTDLLGAGGSGLMDVSAGAGATLVTELEENLVSRLGNAITVQEIKLVGRNI